MHLEECSRKQTGPGSPLQSFIWGFAIRSQFGVQMPQNPAILRKPWSRLFVAGDGNAPIALFQSTPGARVLAEPIVVQSEPSSGKLCLPFLPED